VKQRGTQVPRLRLAAALLTCNSERLTIQQLAVFTQQVHIMPAIMVPDDTFQRLRARADQLNMSVDALTATALEQLAKEPVKSKSTDGWTRHFHEWMTEVQSRAGRYPDGFQADTSRESIYEGCGE
jgi:hypothetical protein